jgi:probable rRNA maturation factor
VIEIEMFGAGAILGAADAHPGERARSPVRGAPTPEEIERLCRLAGASAGVHDGHVAIEFVDAVRITRLNAEYRRHDAPTDVLSFPVDGVASAGTRELGDVVICPEHTIDLREAVVHGMLHLLGMDHETDEGQMLALQRELLRGDSSERP